MTPTNSLGEYRITYERNGFIQYKHLISYQDYVDMIKPSYDRITELEISLNKKNKDVVNKEIRVHKEMLNFAFGNSWFLDKSPLFDAIETGVIILPVHQGGEHKCKIEKI